MAVSLIADPLQALYRGAQACYQLGEFADAVQWLETAHNLAPKDTGVSTLLRCCQRKSTEGVNQARVREEATAALTIHGVHWFMSFVKMRICV
jgi:uncharacterized protein HemY